MLFRFSHHWDLPGDRAAIVALLADIDHYDRWWPQVRSVRRLDAASGLVTMRSLLPVALRVRLARRVEDRAAGTLEVALTGDLTGWARWQVRDGAADYEQECRLTHPRLAPLVRGPLAAVTAPVLRANHTAMMRAGERGAQEALHGTRPPGGRVTP